MRFISKILKKANNKVTVALSMGCDSLAIAHFLKTKYPKIKLYAYHFNHALREQNNEMAHNAMIFCRDFNIPLTYDKRDIVQDVECSEAGLREIRYKAMHDMGYVITGHHLNDAVENYLYNCFNGVQEYLPIPLVTEYNDSGFTVIRPFMLTRKQEMIDYVNQNDLTKYMVEDETNEDEAYRRNWLRHTIIPQISGKGYNLETVVKKKYEKYIKDNH